jgi:hypothetical protein
MSAETARLKNKDWKKWGPYLTNRQWGTVREDYSENGNAWHYVTHDMARSKAYRFAVSLTIIYFVSVTFQYKTSQIYTPIALR